MRKLAQWILIALLLGWLAACGSEAPTPEAPEETRKERPKSILAGQDCLILLLDALHADHLGCYGAKRNTSPNIDQLAEEGVRFTRAWAQSSWTLPSTVSLMTGRFQETHGVRTKAQKLAEGAFTMAKAFSQAGYQCRGFSQMPYASSYFGVDQGFETFENLFMDEGGDGDGIMAEKVIAALKDPDQRPPRLVYAHFRRPHAPYDPPDEWRGEFINPDYSGWVTGLAEDLLRHNQGKDRLSVEGMAHLRDLYQAGIRAVDAEVGEILEAIDRDNTLVIVLSDHGDAFGQHGMVGHNFTAYEEMVHIVYILSHPSLAMGTVQDKPVMSIDILPTLADLFDLESVKKQVQGRTLYAELLGREGVERDCIFTSSKVMSPSLKNQMVAVFDGRFKYLRGPAKKQGLYDLQKDPRETENLKQDRPKVLQKLQAQYDQWKKAQRLEKTGTAARQPQEVLEKLLELGYIGGGVEE